MRFLTFLLVLFCAVTYVLFDSQALQFEQRTVEISQTVQRVASAPVFYPDRLQRYFEKLVSKIGK